MATEKEEFLEDLGEYKNYWNAIHVAADAMAEKMVAGKVYLFIQGTTGSIIVDTANKESWDEQLVGIGGDIIGGVILNAIPVVGTSINISMTVSGNSVGDILKSYYQDIKTEVQGQYWKYEENISVMVGGTMVTYDYAKVKCYSDGNYIMDNATGSPVLEEISQLSYDSHYQKIEQIQNSSVGEDSVSIENIDDKLIIKKTIDNENIQVIQSSQSTTVDLQQTTVIDENGNKTNLFYDENSSLLMYGETIDNPNKISFVNEDGSYEVWEKVNGEFTQSVKIDNTPTNTVNVDTLLSFENDFYNFYTDGLIDNTVYQNISKNFSNYYLQSLPSYTPYTDSYFTPIDIGAFYESTTQTEDKKVSLVKFISNKFYQANSKKVA